MGYGLGKGSPVVLSQSKANFEALIQRHGQYVRWRISNKCTCVTGINSANPKCKKCGGSGERYDYQKDYTDSMRIAVMNNHLIELPSEHADCEVLKAYNALGIEYTVQQIGQYVELSHPQKEPRNGEIVDIVFRQPLFSLLEEAVLVYMGGGFYQVPGVRSDQSKIEGVHYRAPGDIIDMEAVFDAQGTKIEHREYRSDMVLLKDTEAVQPITAFGIKYIKPFKFIILSQNLDKGDEEFLQMHQGEAVCIFSSMFTVSENDVITVLSDAQTKKIVWKYQGDTLPDFFVEQVPYLATEDREYREGTDFVIVGTNKLHWVCADPPVEGCSMAITYQYLPTYRVHKSIPMMRTSEDQRLPRKVVLQLFSGFNESRGVQKND